MTTTVWSRKHDGQNKES